MAKGGFRRALKIENQKIIDHRPPSKLIDDQLVPHPDTLQSEWVETDIPKEIPATLNELISIEALEFVDGSLVWAPDWADQLEARRRAPSPQAVLLRDLSKKVTAEELEQARIELEAERG